MIGVVVFLILATSLMCWILRFDLLATVFTPSLSPMWLQVGGWFAKVDILMVDTFYPPLLCFSSLYVLSVSGPWLEQSFCLHNVWTSQLLCDLCNPVHCVRLLWFVLWVCPDTRGCRRTLDCCYSLRIQFRSVTPVHEWDDYLVSVVLVLCLFVCLFSWWYLSPFSRPMSILVNDINDK